MKMGGREGEGTVKTKVWMGLGKKEGIRKVKGSIEHLKKKKEKGRV